MATSASRNSQELPTAPRLLCLSGRKKKRVFPIEAGEFGLGRVSANDLCIRDPHVSRRHAKIVGRDGGYVLVDLKSRNGTYVNGTPIRERALRHGDEIRIGSERYVFLTGPDDSGQMPTREVVSILDEDDPGRTITLRASVPQSEVRLEPVTEAADDALSTERQGRHIAVIHRMAQIMVSDIDQPELLQRLSDALIDGFRAGRACVLLRGGRSGELVPAAVSFRKGEPTEQPPLSGSIASRVIGDRTAMLCSDARSDDRFAEAHSVGKLDIRSVMCAPMLHKDALLGLLYVDSRSSPDEFDEEDLRLLSTVAAQAAVVVENHSLVVGMRQRLQDLQEQVEEGEPAIIAKSSVMKEIVSTARKAADSSATILILGESGTGKEVLAKSIHRWSQRAAQPFVVVNCAALSDHLLQSDLFGHERGAFTGAVKQKKGRLELAHQGTVFLDEIGELGLDLQAKLLRFLEEREFERVGGTQPINVDVRVVAASNRDLAAEVARGRFREDLYFRLRVIEVHMPPLRVRKEDVPLLAEKFLHDSAAETGRSVTGFSRSALELLGSHHWPGNVRELRNAVERAVVLSAGEVIEREDLGLGAAGGALCLDESLTGYHEQIRELKKQVIRDALARADGIQSLAAEHLGLQPSYLSRLMKNLGMR